MVKFNLEFGLLCDPISDRLDKYNITYSSKEVEGFQKDTDAINRVSIRHLVPASQINMARDKLAKRIFDHIHTKSEEFEDE